MGAERYMILNGELLEWQHVEGAFVYQYIHTLNYAPYNLSQHIKIISQASESLFELQFEYRAQDISKQIASLLGVARLSRKVSIGVTLKHYASGDVSIEYDTPSIYSGYVMRSLRPDATCLRMQIPLEGYPTSAAIEAYNLAEAIAQGRGYHTAIIIDADDTIRCDTSHPIALVREKTLYIANTSFSVEHNMLEQATRKAGYKVEYSTLKRADLATADEVIVMSWQGLTAMQTVNGKPYMSIIAENIAKKFEK